MNVEFSPNGAIIVSGSDDNIIKLCDSEDGKIKTLEGHTRLCK